jgi:multicomponent Na+:H+ antiporter subunit D
MLPSLPVLLPFATGILLLLLRGQPDSRRVVSLVSLVLQILVAGWLLVATFNSGVLVSHMGDWKAPLGITLVGDKTAAILVMLALIVTLTATLTGFFRAPRLVGKSDAPAAGAVSPHRNSAQLPYRRPL